MIPPQICQTFIQSTYDSPNGRLRESVHSIDEAYCVWFSQWPFDGVCSFNRRGILRMIPPIAVWWSLFIQSTRHTAYDSPNSHLRDAVHSIDEAYCVWFSQWPFDGVCSFNRRGILRMILPIAIWGMLFIQSTRHTAYDSPNGRLMESVHSVDEAYCVWFSQWPFEGVCSFSRRGILREILPMAIWGSLFIQSTRHTAYDSPNGDLRETVPSVDEAYCVWFSQWPFEGDCSFSRRGILREILPIAIWGSLFIQSTRHTAYDSPNSHLRGVCSFNRRGILRMILPIAIWGSLFIQSTRHTAYDSPNSHLRESVHSIDEAYCVWFSQLPFEGVCSFSRRGIMRMILPPLNGLLCD